MAIRRLVIYSLIRSEWARAPDPMLVGSANAPPEVRRLFPTLPPRPLFRTIAIRVVVLFVALRAVAAGIGGGLGVDPIAALSPSVPGIVWTWAAVVLALRIDLARRAELVLLANLGFSFRRVAMIAVAICAGLDVALRLVV